jgi:hypothetical protein
VKGKSKKVKGKSEAETILMTDGFPALLPFTFYLFTFLLPASYNAGPVPPKLQRIDRAS